MPPEVIKALVAGAVGAIIAWTGHSFTIDGEMTAFQRTLIRIESRLDNIEAAQTSNTARIIKEVKP